MCVSIFAAMASISAKMDTHIDGVPVDVRIHLCRDGVHFGVNLLVAKGFRGLVSANRLVVNLVDNRPRHYVMRLVKQHRLPSSNGIEPIRTLSQNSSHRRKFFRVGQNLFKMPHPLLQLDAVAVDSLEYRIELAGNNGLKQW